MCSKCHTTMEDWYWDVNSPSFKAGIDNLTETRYRTEGAKFISTIGQQLKLYPSVKLFFFYKQFSPL